MGMDHQEKMNAVFDNYLKLSDMLTADGMALLELDDNNDSWRRNFIRACSALLEGYSHCFREILNIGIEMEPLDLTNKERKVILSESSIDTADRIKYTLRSAYKVLNLSPAPDFSSQDWANAKYGLDKRHSLMHPKIPEDLEISDDAWDRIHSGFTWLVEAHFNVIKLLYEMNIEKSN